MRKRNSSKKNSGTSPRRRVNTAIGVPSWKENGLTMLNLRPPWSTIMRPKEMWPVKIITRVYKRQFMRVIDSEIERNHHLGL